MSRSKAFMFGCLGAGLVLAIAAIIAPLYSDWRARARSDEILAVAVPLQEKIGSLIEQGKVPELMQASKKQLILDGASKPIANADVLSNGTIALVGKKDGQVMLLVPSLVQGKVMWRCLGGSAKDVPLRCRDSE
jgi:hypothetical protein